jgi:hypothetical protein
MALSPMQSFRVDCRSVHKKEVQEMLSCRGTWGCPPVLNLPHEWGIQGVDEILRCAQNDSNFWIAPS